MYCKFSGAAKGGLGSVRTAPFMYAAAKAIESGVPKDAIRSFVSIVVFGYERGVENSFETPERRVTCSSMRNFLLSEKSNVKNSKCRREMIRRTESAIDHFYNNKSVKTIFGRDGIYSLKKSDFNDSLEGWQE